MTKLAKLARGRTVLVLLAVNLVFVLWLFPMARGWVIGGDCSARCQQLQSLAELQLCFSAETFWHIVDGWVRVNPAAVGAFLEGLVAFDFLFPLAYAAFLSSLFLWSASRVGRPVWPALAFLPWLAAAFDYIENIGTIAVLVHGRPAMLTTSASLAVLALSTLSALKWTLALATALSIVVAVLDSAFGRVLWICRYGFLSVALGTIPILFVPQGQDILRGLVDVESPIVRAWSFVFLLAWASSVWYWSRVLLMLRLDWEQPSSALREWQPRVLGFAACLGFGIACAAAASGMPRARGVQLWIHAVTSGMLAVLFLVGVRERRRAFATLARAASRIGVAEIRVAAVDETFDWRALPGLTRLAFALTVALSLGFLWFFSRSLVATRLGTLSILFLTAANAVFIGSLTVFLGRLWRLPLVTIAFVLAAGFSAWNDNHVVRLSPPVAARSPSLRPDLEAAFGHWIRLRQSERKPGEPIPLVLVAAEGGGLRAAYWTATALGHIQDRAPGFARQVFAISGVSGGSLGAAVFASLVERDLASRGAPGSLGPCESAAETAPASDLGYGRFEACAAAALSSNFLAPTLARMVSADFSQWFLPFPIASFDRGKALEDSWASAYQQATQDDALSRSLLELYSRNPGSVPALLLNVAHVETGRRLVESPFRFDAAVFHDSYDLLAAVAADLPLKTAVHNSARFAYISPAARLRSRGGAELGHVVDGGYFENSGAVTLLELERALRGLEQRMRAAGELSSPIRYHALYLCNSPLRCGRGPIQAADVDPTAPAEVADLLSPLRALLGAREARGSLALTELPAAFPGDYTELGACPLTVAEEKAAPLPLGWQLSTSVRDRLRAQLRECPGGEGCGGPCIPAPSVRQAIARVLEVVAR